MSKVILYIATSQDGFIADSKGNVDWLPEPKNEQDLEIVGYNKLMDRIDTIAMGHNSYEKVLTFGDWGCPTKQSYVFTFEPLKTDLDCIKFTSDSPVAWLQKLNNKKDIWLMGGAQLAQSFAQENLIDEIILTLIPQKIGQGISLGLSFDNFNLKNEKQLFDDMIQRTYSKN